MKLEAFDRIALGAIAALLAAIGLVVAAGDHVGVAIVSRIPEPNSQPAATTTIEIEFGEQVRQATVEAAFSLSPEVSGQINWQENRMIFTADEPFKSGQTVTVRLAAGVQSVTGRERNRELSWTFSPRQPELLYLAPADIDIRGLWLQSLDTTQPPMELIRPEFGVLDYAPSPDGTQIAVTVPDEIAASNIWLYDRDGQNAELIISCSPGVCSSPAWAPDGRTLAYQRQDPSPQGPLGPSRIWVYDLVLGQTGPLMEDNQVLGFSPVWSPTGQRIAFYDANAEAIRVLNLQPGDVRSILLPTLMGEVGSFTADGEQMVYTDLQQVGRQYFSKLWQAQFDSSQGIAPMF